MARESLRLRHLDFNRRVALRIRLATALAFRREGLPGASKKSTTKQDSILKKLDAASIDARANAKPPIRDAIRQALPNLDKIEFDSRLPAENVLAQRLQLFRTLIDDFDCPFCTVPDVGKHEPPHDACRCMTELHELFDKAGEVAASLYRQFSKKRDISWPALFLETADVPANQTTDVLDVAAVTGACRYGFVGGRPASVVGLVVRDDGFCWTSMAQLPYVLMHELVCHAYQGLKGPKRVAVDKTCPWSEGWMDAIAIAVAEEWAEGAYGVELPVWAQSATDFVRRAGSRLHERRLESQASIDPEVLDARMHAHDAFLNLQKSYQGKNPQPASARSRVLLFSLELNLHVMTQIERGEIAEWIGLGMELGKGDEIANICSRFAEHDDWHRLYNDLKLLMNP